MSNTKRLLSVVLVLVMLLCGIAFQAFATEAQPVASNAATGEEYTGILPALMAATSGQTVTLLEDVTETGWVLVPADVVLDLNGKSLTAPYLSSYGTVIDSSEANTGLLSVPTDRIYIRQDNTQLPVCTAAGYRFVQINKFNETILEDGRYAFDFRPETAAHALLLPGVETSGVKVQVEVSWKQENGTRNQLFEYTDKYVTEFINSYNAETGKYGRMFTLSLYGAEGLQDLSFRVRLQSAVMVALSSAGVQTTPATPPATDVTTDGNGQTTEDVTVSNNTASAEVATGTQLEEGTTSLTLTTTELTESDKNITIGDGEESRSVDVHVEGVAPTNTVPIIITMKAFAPEFLNQGNLKLIHVEDGVPVEMTRVGSIEEVDVHNEYYYDVITGDVVMALATFSEVTAVADTENPWQGKYDYSWYTNAAADTKEYTIVNADQLAGLSAIVGGMDGQTQDTFQGKTVKLIANIKIGDMDSENKDAEGKALVFYPIGYYNSDGTYERTGTAITSSFKPFMGTFDGNGNTISDFVQNTWEMKGDHNWYDAKLQYYRDGMGLFGKVYGGTVKNLTVKNFSCDGEIATAGTIAAYADAGATFENISIFECNPRVYNIGNGGIVGCIGWYAEGNTEATPKVTFRNITVDNTNKISALWGSWDVPCGGLVGQYYHHSGQDNTKNPGIAFENCHVSAQIDVNNDVCANYQYYQYRYSGMLIGTVREVVTEGGVTVPNTDGITATGCTVDYGTWNEYWYCELVGNSQASYTHDYQFSRLERIKSVNEIKSGDTWTKTGNFVIPAADNKSAVCYHIVKDADGNLKQHLHTEMGRQKDAAGNDVDVTGEGDINDLDLVEDRQRYFMPFKQLISGNSGYATYKLETFDGVVVNENSKASVQKFVPNLTGTNMAYYSQGMPIKLSELFKLNEGVSDSSIDKSALSVFVSPATEGETATGTYTRPSDSNYYWGNGTLTIDKFTGSGVVKVTITDYHYCTNTVITLKPLSEEVGMYRQVTNIDTVLADSQNAKARKYVVVAEKDGIHYALGLNGAAQQVYVLDEFIIGTPDVPAWILGNDGTYTLRRDTSEGAAKQFLARDGKTLTQKEYGIWTIDSVGTAGLFKLGAADLSENEDSLAIAYYVDNNGKGSFGVYGEDHSAADHVFSLKLYKRIDCLHTNKKAQGRENPTCSKVGYEAGELCVDCGEWVSGHGEIGMTDHTFDANNMCTMCGAIKTFINGKDVVLLKWTKPDSLPTNGAYYLGTNVTVDENYNVGKDGLILDLHGHTVTRKFTEDNAGTTPRVYTLIQSQDTELYITDLSEGQTKGTIELDIENNAMDEYKALSDAQRRGTLISVLSGKLILEEGTLDGSEAQCAGFGQATVFVNSGETMEMTGGVVIGGTNETDENKDYGNGSAIYICRDSTATITGGIIVGGKAYAGAAIYAAGNVTVGGNAVVIAGIAEGEVSSTSIGATLGDSIYAGAYTEQANGITIGSKLTISGNAKINGGITVNKGLGLVVEGTPTIDKTMNISAYQPYLTEHNKGNSVYSLAMPQRWVDDTKDPDYNDTMRLDVSGLTGGNVNVSGFTTFTKAFTSEADAKRVAALVKCDLPGQSVIVKQTNDGFVLAMGWWRCANGHTVANCAAEQDCPVTTCDEKIVWWEHWDFNTYLPGTGNFVLSRDVTHNNSVSPRTGPLVVGNGDTLRIDLNGHNIVRNVPAEQGHHAVFSVSGNGSLTITDLAGNGRADGTISLQYENAVKDRSSYGGLVTVNANGKFTLCGGILNGSTVFCDGYINDANANDGTVALHNGGAEFVMYGGKIIGMTNTVAGKETKGSALGVMSSSNATIKGGTIAGDSATNGGAIANAGTLTITGGTITGGSATNGGTIYNNGSLTISGGTISGGKATDGGAIYSTANSTITVNGGNITGGTTKATNGGTIYNVGTLTVKSSIGAGTATNGGTVYNTGTLTLESGTIAAGTGTATNGGTIYNAGTVNAKGGTISGGKATNGGAIYSSKTLTISGGTISGGNATSGGVIYSESTATTTISGNAKITGGTATYGGTIYNAGTVNANGGTITGGSATNGGAIYNTGSVIVGGGTITGSNVTGSAGAIYSTANSTITVNNGTISGGSATNGGNIFTHGTLIITGGTISNGTARGTTTNAGLGGNIYIATQNGKVSITGGTITEGTVSGSDETTVRSYNICTQSTCNAVIEVGGTAQIAGGFTVNGAGSFTLSGKPQINRTLAKSHVPTYSLNLSAGKMITVGTMGDGAYIGIYRTGIFTTEFTSKAAADAAAKAFKGANGIYVVAKTLSTYVLSHGNTGFACANNHGNGCTNTTCLFYDTAALTLRCVHGSTACTKKPCTGNLLWEKWTSTTTLPKTNGNYILNGNVTVSTQTDIALDQKVVLDLNGYKITRTVTTAADSAPRVYQLSGNSGQTKGAELIITDTKSTTGTITVTYPTSVTSVAGSVYGAMINVQSYANLTIYNGILDGTNVISSTSVGSTGIANGIIVAQANATVTINGGTLKGMRNRATGNSSGGSVIGGMGSSTITINGGTLSAWTGTGDVADRGGAISTGGNLTITGGTITGGKVTNNGGTIYCTGTLTISGGTITGSSATNGGAIYCTGTLKISGGTITGSSVTNGGAIYCTGTLTISGGTFNAGTASNQGGILHLTAAVTNATITSGTFNGVGNVTAKQSKRGGLIYNGGTLSITGGTFKNGLDKDGGRNIWNVGTLTIGGNAQIAGEVMSYGTDSAPAKLIVSGKAVIDSTLSAEGLNRNYNIRVNRANVYLNNTTGNPIYTAKDTTKVLWPTYSSGNITGVTDVKPAQ